MSMTWFSAINLLDLIWKKTPHWGLGQSLHCCRFRDILVRHKSFWMQARKAKLCKNTFEKYDVL